MSDHRRLFLEAALRAQALRFGAFTPAKAESLCKQLQKRGTSCLVVTDGAWDQASARASLPIAVR